MSGRTSVEPSPEASATPPRLAAESAPSRVSKSVLQYLGFSTGSVCREYRLQVRLGEDTHVFVVSIPHAAFAQGRARLQDGPDICYLRMQRQLLACGIEGPTDVTISDQELAEYHVAHSPIPRGAGRAFSAAAAGPVAGPRP
jgi:hypothetical protein